MKILSLPVGMDACSYYRIKKPLEGLEKAGHDTHVITSEDDMDMTVKSMNVADVLFTRPGAEQGLEKLKKTEGISFKAKVVLDIDDNIDLISPYSQFYEAYGTCEVFHNGKKLWKDGVKNFSIHNNVVRITNLKWAMKTADLVTVTTQKLAEFAEQYNPNIYINPNTIDFNHWWRLNNAPNPRMKVVWQGSPSHFEDWVAIREPLNQIMREHDFDLYMLGSNYMGVFDKEHQHKVFSLPWVPFEAHSYRLMSLQPDFAIIPLVSSDPEDEIYQEKPFNQYKSSIKWYEMCAMGVPSVVSDVVPYKLDIKNNHTALGYSTQKEFYQQMKRMITDASLRKKISENGYQWVKNHRNLELESKKLSASLKELVD